MWPLVPTRSFDEPFTYAAAPGQLYEGALVEIPVGAQTRVGLVAALDAPVPPGVTVKPVGRLIDLPPMPASSVRLAQWVASQYGCATTVALSLVVPPKLAAQARASAVPTRARQLAARRVAGADTSALTTRQREVVDSIGAGWQAVATVVERAATTRPTLAKLATLGALEIEERFLDELDDPAGVPAATDATDEPAAAERPPELTDEQLAAVETCWSATPDDPATALVGITGSGKTEVYLELLRRTLAAGRGAIVLVPEISLTPQTSRRFVRRFPGLVEVLHSGMTRAARQAAWERIARGQSRVVIGPRSAVFAPVHELGLVVVDEEHDGSYKQESEPRYDARRVAWRRALLDGARVVFGSATPRAETWHGVARRAVMRTRPAGGVLAPVTLVNLRDAADDYPFAAETVAAIEQTLERGRKVVVLHNRRGYATALHCRTCGGSLRCPACDVALVVHGARAAEQQLACHHCGHREPVPRQCRVCGAADVARMGAGTERLERDLAHRFAVPVVRMDADSVQRGRGVSAVLDSFAGVAGPAILAGTQMIAKGHDFPDVELAVVVDADAALAIPDFRAEERAFSLVAQLAGRAGRSADTAQHARVLVQSWEPRQEFLQFALHHDVAGFLDAELARRADHGYPPFTRLVRVEVSAPTAADARVWGQAVADGMRALEAGSLLGPATLLRINRRERVQLLLRTHHTTAVAAALRQFLRRTAADRTRCDVRVIVDVDPQTVV